MHAWLGARRDRTLGGMKPNVHDIIADIEAIAARCDRVFAKLQHLAAADKSDSMTAALAGMAAMDFDAVTSALERAA